MGSQKYASQVFQNINPAKWARIADKVKASLGIDMATTMGSESSPAEATAKGITLSWVYSPDTEILVIDLVRRSVYDPSEGEIDQRVEDWITNA